MIILVEIMCFGKSISQASCQGVVQKKKKESSNVKRLLTTIGLLKLVQTGRRYTENRPRLIEQKGTKYKHR